MWCEIRPSALVGVVDAAAAARKVSLSGGTEGWTRMKKRKICWFLAVLAAVVVGLLVAAVPMAVGMTSSDVSTHSLLCWFEHQLLVDAPAAPVAAVPSSLRAQ